MVRPITFVMLGASLCAGMTRLSGRSSMETHQENVSRLVIKPAPNERTMRRAAGSDVRGRLIALLPVGISLIAAVVYAFISIYRHDHFGSNAFDLGVQDQ